MTNVLLFGNVSQPPYCNNLFPPVRAFQKAFRTTLVEPFRLAGFAPTGGAKPALVPDEAVIAHTDPPPDIVVCLGGALHFSERARRIFPRRDAARRVRALGPLRPGGLDRDRAASSTSSTRRTRAPFRTTRCRRIAAKRCDPATDPELYLPERVAPECDVVYYGKWTAYRDSLVAALAGAFSVRVHAYDGESRWSVPVAAAARHARDAARRHEPRPPHARDRPARRRPGPLPRRVPDHAARLLRGLVRRAVAHRILRRPGGVLRARPRDRGVHVSRGRRPPGRAAARPTRRPAPPWAAAPASAPCASTRGTGASRISSSTCGSGRRGREPGRRASCGETRLLSATLSHPLAA